MEWLNKAKLEQRDKLNQERNLLIKEKYYG